jgi:nucleoside-diphosphate-sugar epimerase
MIEGIYRLMMSDYTLSVDDPKQRRPDITKARALLKWEPRFSLERGLKETIKYFKDMLGVIK